ncbi:hypothetical protein [Nocardia barduliensis]|uniref:hypothetical protein n=1 Tax=Nocardia barduliensis TaxID=2736643 RepID=UPI00157257F3|nr:hypothetical protein [Nocardia barduliensis]
MPDNELHPRKTSSKFLNDVGWGDVPPRYGGSPYQMWRISRGQGLFVRLREALKDDPSAAGLVAWLDQMIAEPGARKRHDREAIPS